MTKREFKGLWITEIITYKNVEWKIIFQGSMFGKSEQTFFIAPCNQEILLNPNFDLGYIEAKDVLKFDKRNFTNKVDNLLTTEYANAKIYGLWLVNGSKIMEESTIFNPELQSVIKTLVHEIWNNDNVNLTESQRL